MEALKNFGLDPYLTIAQIVNFLIILYILKRFLYPPLFKVLQKRQQLAKEAIEKAEESKKLLANAQEKEKAMIKQAKETSDQIIREAQEQAQIVINKAEEEAKKRADALIQAGKFQIGQESKTAEAELSSQISRLSLELLRKSIAGIFTEKQQEEIMGKALKELNQ